MAKNLRKNQKELQKKLEELLGSRNVYFQPPENIKLKYPCIIYELNSFDRDYADNLPYLGALRYSLMYVSRTPVDDIFDKLCEMPYSWFERAFVSDNLNHQVFRIFH